ncbi:hypothetical protein ABEB36_001774 [Hypothenemus hampei]|uniref:UV radiation resistance-associated gene protein n=1 Tax=Hypothenemus hampei TaxID=57062 RepID=A0ABD1FFR4_HYPHA
MNVTLEFPMGRQRSRGWVPLITQQLRLRHIYQIYAYNVTDNRKASFYFTLHNTPLSCPFYTSEVIGGRNLKWNELFLDNSINTNVSSVVIRIWTRYKNEDKMLLTWGVNFSGLVHLGNRISDLHPKYFKANTVIFVMQGVYFTSHKSIRNDLEKPFEKRLNLFENVHNEQMLYKKVAVKCSKSEIATSYSLEKLRKLQHLQRQLRDNRVQVREVQNRIKTATEREPKQDFSDSKLGSQLLTMNSLNKMLREVPTQAEKKEIEVVARKIEFSKFRLKLLQEEKDKMSSYLRKIKLQESQLREGNEEKNSVLMSMYHVFCKECHQWNEYKTTLTDKKELLTVITDQLRLRQSDLLKELLFIYPTDKLPNEDKYTMLGIHLPDSELLLDCQDPGVSVVLGYISHVLTMCSIFLQVPLRHPVKHFGSRSVIYDQVYPDIPDKEREFHLYTKGKDKAHFSYAVFLLNKNISQLRWYFQHKTTPDLKETLKHVRLLLLGEDLTTRNRPDHSQRTTAPIQHPLSLSSSNLNDPLLERFHEEMGGIQGTTTVGMITPRAVRKNKTFTELEDPLAVPEAYLNKQITKDLFHKCATGAFHSGSITILQGVEEKDTCPGHSDSVEEGADPLDPSTNLDLHITKPKDILAEPSRYPGDKLGKSVDSSLEDYGKSSKNPELSSYNSTKSKDIQEDHLMKNDAIFPQDILRLSLHELSMPLTERTDRLLSSNQSFNLVRHRPLD